MINYGLECYVGRLASISDDRITENFLMHNVADVGMLWNASVECPGEAHNGLDDGLLLLCCSCRFVRFSCCCCCCVVASPRPRSKQAVWVSSPAQNFFPASAAVGLFVFPHLKIGSNLYSL